MRRVLVTGVTGFAGSHLVDYMLERDDSEIIGIQRWRSRTENIEHFADRITLLECDLRDASSTRDTLEKVRPDWIFHLAAQSFVPTSWTAPTESLTTNIIGQINLFEAVRKLGMKCRIQLACSSEEYGLVLPDELPIKETNPLRPLSPYAVSKVGQDLLGYQYWMSWKLDCVRTRGFNHEGPRRGPVFVASDFAKQIADIEKGRKPRSSRSATSRRSVISPTCATWCAPTGWHWRNASQARSTTSAPAQRGRSARCSTSCCR